MYFLAFSGAFYCFVGGLLGGEVGGSIGKGTVDMYHDK